MTRIIALGGVTQDLYATIEEAATSSPSTLSLQTDVKQAIHHLATHPGGGAHNVAVSLAAQGLSTSIGAVIGNDPAGMFITQNLITHSVNTTALHTSAAAPTGTSFIMRTPTGKTAIASHRGANNELCATVLPMDFVTQHPYIYITSLSSTKPSLLTTLVQAVRHSSTMIACNPGSRQLTPTRINDLLTALPQIDVLLLNHIEAQQCAQTMLPPGSSEYTFAQHLLQSGPDIVAITHGAAGVHAYTPHHHYHAPRIPAETVDTVGAGDAFGSGFVGGLIQGLSIEDALSKGLHTSAAVIAHLGAQTGLHHTGV